MRSTRRANGNGTARLVVGGEWLISGPSNDANDGSRSDHRRETEVVLAVRNEHEPGALEAVQRVGCSDAQPRLLRFEWSDEAAILRDRDSGKDPGPVSAHHDRAAAQRRLRRELIDLWVVSE